MHALYASYAYEFFLNNEMYIFKDFSFKNTNNLKYIGKRY